MQLFNRMTANFSLSCDPVTLSEHQGHSNWTKTVEYSRVQHHPKLERNQLTRTLTQDNVNHIFYQIMSAEFFPSIVFAQNKFSMSFNKPASHGINRTSSKSTVKFLRKQTLKFWFLIHVTLNEGQVHLNWYSNVALTGPYYHTKLERNWSVTVWIKANVKGFFKQSKQAFLPWILTRRDKMSMRFITPTSLNSIPYPIQTDWKLWDNWRRSFCFFACLWPWIMVKLT